MAETRPNSAHPSPRESMAKFKAARMATPAPMKTVRPKTSRPVIEKFKIDNAYDDTPPCRGRCKHYKKPKTLLRDSLPTVHITGVCRAGGFSTGRYAVCDTWEGRDGSLLTTYPTTAQETK